MTTGTSSWRSGHALAIVPGLTHDTTGASPLLAQAAIDFLDRDEM